MILHDLPPGKSDILKTFAKNSDTVFAAEPIVQPCIGCFGCWIKTPGRCVIDDRGTCFAALLSAHDEIIAVSRLVFGGFSPSVKALFDRSIGAILPFFKVVNGETHHPKRNKSKLDLRYIFYGDDMTPFDMEIARKLVAANAFNFSADKYSVDFYKSADDIEVAV
jgi:multimeric flavodoxin WrbA